MSADAPKDVKMMIFELESASSMRLVASAPLRMGIIRSMMTTSGLSSFASETAFSPFAASPTTVMSGW